LPRKTSGAQYIGVNPFMFELSRIPIDFTKKRKREEKN